MSKVLDTIKGVHRFFSDQLLYPLILGSLLAGLLYFARVLRSDSWTYRNLVWNLFLAWVPYLVSLGAASLHLLAPGRRLILLVPGVLWLAFFPNAPYILTDFLHLAPRPGVPLWYDILMLSIFAWTGMILAIASLRIMHALVRHYLGRIISWAFVLAALGMGGAGIYLGRFSRFNSWDLLLMPKEVLRDILPRLVDPLSHPRFYGFTLLFSAFLLVVYLAFASVHRIWDHRSRSPEG